MKLQSNVFGACVGAFVLLASPAQASSGSYSGASAAASAAHNATNSAVQSAVQSARDDAARRALAQQWNVELRRAHRHRLHR
jgi:hypothetical protein